MDARHFRVHLIRGLQHVCLQALELPTDCCLNGAPSLRRSFIRRLTNQEQKSGFPSLQGRVPCPWWASRRNTGWAGEAGRIAAFAGGIHWDSLAHPTFYGRLEDLQRFFLFNHATVKVNNTNIWHVFVFANIYFCGTSGTGTLNISLLRSK